MIVKRRRDLLPALVCLAALGTVVDLAAQKRATQVDAASQGSSAVDDIPSLPADMLPVEGGAFEIGAEAKDLLDIEAKLYPYSVQQRLKDLQRLMSELGTRKVTVAPFYMSKFPVTNAQYKAFVDKTGWRFPFHWWSEGQKAHFEQSREKINETIQQNVSDKPLAYWKLNWKELPSAIPPGQEEYPVVYVAWRDAIAYAAWAGMRLPTEIEWTFAATGGNKRPFVWGDDLEGLTVPTGPRYDKMFEVGHWGEATQGAFGHQDMALGVWEWTGDLGFFSFPENKRDFERELDKLFRDTLFKDKDDSEVAATMKFRPMWAGDKVVAKGGMWVRTDKSTLRVGTRAPIESLQTLSALGFRLAKTPIPARDMSDSRIKLDYDYSYWGAGRKPNVADQVGIERYDLSPDAKQILGYHAISIVPANFGSVEKTTKDKLLASTVDDHRPFVVGTLITTEQLKEPAVEPGIYTIAFRYGGMPADLRKALPEARKALTVAEKSGAELEAGEWQKVLRKYNITDEEAKAGDVDFVRLNPGELKVTADEHTWILRNDRGDYVNAFKALKVIDTAPRYADGDATVEIEVRPDGTERLNFELGVPVEAEQKRAYTMSIRLEVDAAHAGGDKWRIPVKKAR